MSLTRRRLRNARLLPQGSADGRPTLADEAKVVSPDVVNQEVDRKGVAYLEAGGALQETKIKLWDAVENRWTSPLPQVTANMNLRVIVEKCTACIFTTSGVGGKAGMVETHIHNVMTAMEAHKSARIMARIGIEGEQEFCSACEVSFRSRPARARTHIQEVIDRGKAHYQADKVTMYRFLQGPPVADIETKPVVEASAPQVHEESQPPVKRRRRRSRGRKRQVAHA